MASNEEGKLRQETGDIVVSSKESQRITNQKEFHPPENLHLYHPEISRKHLSDRVRKPVEHTEEIIKSLEQIEKSPAHAASGIIPPCLFKKRQRCVLPR